ncbi:Panacea domain-containing protein [Lactococcus petauri]|uniref:Panacea domain-containing protein n=1 Tax=Lactococcus petauri TaxID=1940789 RepID=UPI00254A8AB5|nr:type II toxin-antitoxin system antitoxin SocA domain-containing protein [Lactococcus petauri]
MNKFKIQEPIAVANFIIKYAQEHELSVSNLHLQKILYYLQAAFLVKYDGNPLINASFSRWSYGPVVPDVYNAFRENGSSSIQDLSPNISIQDGKWEIKAPENIDISEFDKESQELLVNTIDTLLKENPWNLVNRTHEQSLWYDYKEDIERHLARDYSNAEIQKYFSENVGEQIWQA